MGHRGEKESAISALSPHHQAPMETFSLSLWHCALAIVVVCAFQMLISIEFTSKSAGAANLQIRRKVQHSMSGLIICAIYEYYVTHWLAAVGTLLAASLAFFCVSLSPSQIASSKRTFPESFQTDHAPSRSPLAARRVLLLAWLCHQLCGL